jgi:predicted enzyme related to lactoylglutathione lyase
VCNRVTVNITKTYFMLSVSDMDRAVVFYRDVIGLAVDFESPFWSELHWRDATIALHGGGADEERESWLGFHVADLDAALAEVEAAGARRGEERTEGGARLVAVVDPFGNRLTLGASSNEAAR